MYKIENEKRKRREAQDKQYLFRQGGMKMNEAIQTINLASEILKKEEPKFYQGYFQRFINDSGINEKTSSNYIIYLRHFAKWIHSEGITNPTRQDIRDYKKYLNSYISEKTGKKLEPTTKQQYFQIVKTFFQFLENEELFKDISKGIDGFKIDKEPRKRNFTDEEILKIINSIDTTTEKGKRNKAMILLSVENGLRIIEIQRANVEDLETIDNQTRLFIQGKGKQEKTDFVNLSKELSELIEEYISSRGNPKGSEPLFTTTGTRRKNERIEITSISRIIKSIFKENGFNSRKLTPHSLRHTSGTIYYEETKDIRKVQLHQRHSSITSTTIYEHSHEKKNDNSGQVIHNRLFSKESTNSREKLLQTINSLSEDDCSKIAQYIDTMKGSDSSS